MAMWNQKSWPEAPRGEFFLDAIKPFSHCLVVVIHLRGRQKAFGVCISEVIKLLVGVLFKKHFFDFTTCKFLPSGNDLPIKILFKSNDAHKFLSVVTNQLGVLLLGVKAVFGITGETVFSLVGVDVDADVWMHWARRSFVNQTVGLERRDTWKIQGDVHKQLRIAK